MDEAVHIRFWKWFIDHEDEIIRAVEARDEDWLRNEVTPRVLELTPPGFKPRINWEVGPGVSKPWRFCLSPLVRQNLAKTRKIIAHAPSLPKWEFWPAKPPRAMKTLKYSLADKARAKVTVCADDWEYVLLEHGEGRYSVLLVSTVPIDCGEDFRDRFAYLIVEGLIGEEAAIEHIADMQLFGPGELDPSYPTTELAKLKQHLESCVAKELDRN